MARRKTLLATGETYHVFNKSAHKIPIFKTEKDYLIFMEAVEFYQHSLPPTKFSIYRRMKNNYSNKSDENLVIISCYCLMPNHFHFILRQEMEHGIKEFIRKLTSSFSHYYNKKYETSGPLFTGNFKAVRIEDEDQLIHLSRYIHLNPVTSRIVERPEDYIYSSYKSFLKKEKVNILRPEVIIGDMSPIEYEKFVLNQINYQRQLKEIRHLLIE